MGILRGTWEVLKGLVKGQWHEGYYVAKRQNEIDLILRFYGNATKNGQFGDPNFRGIQECYWVEEEGIKKYGKKACYRMSSKLIHPLKMGSFLLMDDFVMERLLKWLPIQPRRAVYQQLFLFAYGHGLMACLPHETNGLLRLFKAVPGFLTQGYLEEYARHVFEFYDELLNRALTPEERRLIGGSIFYVDVDKERKVMSLRDKPFYFYPLGLLHVGGVKGDYLVFYADYKDALELLQTSTEKEPLEMLLSEKALKNLYYAAELVKQGKASLEGFVGWTALVGIGLYEDGYQTVVVLVDGGQGMYPEWLPYEVFSWKRVGSKDWKENLSAILEKNVTLVVAFANFIKQNAEQLKGKIEYLPYGLLVTTSQTKDKSHWRLHPPLVEAPLKVDEYMQTNVLDGWGGMKGREVRRLYATWTLDNVMMGAGQSREVLDYIKAVNQSALSQIKSSELNVIRAGHLRLSQINEVISYLLDRNKEVAKSFEKGEIRESVALPMYPYLVGTYYFLRATEDAYAIDNVDVPRLVEFNERQLKVVDLYQELRKEVENGQGNKV